MMENCKHFWIFNKKKSKGMFNIWYCRKCGKEEVVVKRDMVDKYPLSKSYLR